MDDLSLAQMTLIKAFGSFWERTGGTRVLETELATEAEWYKRSGELELRSTLLILSKLTKSGLVRRFSNGEFTLTGKGWDEWRALTQ